MRSSRHPARAGFTLIELLVVIGIVMLLLGLLMGGLAVARRQAHRAATLSDMQQLTHAVTMYLDIWPWLGDAPDAAATDFRKTPWTYLTSRMAASGRQPLVQFPVGMLVSGGSGASSQVTEPGQATHIVDQWGGVYSWQVVMRQAPGGVLWFVESLRLRSSCGTPTRDGDDLVLEFTSTSGNFTQVPFSATGTTGGWSAPMPPWSETDALP